MFHTILFEGMVEPSNILKCYIHETGFEEAFLLRAFLKTLDPMGRRDCPFFAPFGALARPSPFFLFFFLEAIGFQSSSLELSLGCSQLSKLAKESSTI
jgi:hypothetical protein